MMKRVLVFDSHPVQYRVPIWRHMESMALGSVHVAYATDCTVRKFTDRDFGKTFVWDDPMLEGYRYSVLGTESETPLQGWGSLTGRGVRSILSQSSPTAVLLTGLNYRYDLAALREAYRQRIPIWLRCENQDEAFSRGPLKAMLRSFIYRTAYRFIDRFFYIGNLNKEHYLRHGVKEGQLKPARYATVDRFSHFKDAEKFQIRNQQRQDAGIDSGGWVLGFSGKFIPKKQPDMLFELVEHIPDELKKRLHLYYLGSGPMDQELRVNAGNLESSTGIKTWFAGFANQSQLAAHYLAMDGFILPSRRMGETWGLVVNEAMQAGCSIAVSDAAGCHADFDGWERLKVFPTGDAQGAAKAVTAISEFSRSFDWAQEKLSKDYSIQATAKQFLQELNQE